MTFRQASLAGAMILINGRGKLPLKLKRFAEDRMLGLGRYGKASLYFVTLQVVGAFTAFPPSV